MTRARCPSCHTLFKIGPEQLKARQGLVRCGHCQTPFNAYEHLAEPAPKKTFPSDTDSTPESKTSFSTSGLPPLEEDPFLSPPKKPKPPPSGAAATSTSAERRPLSAAPPSEDMAFWLPDTPLSEGGDAAAALAPPPPPPNRTTGGRAAPLPHEPPPASSTHTPSKKNEQTPPEEKRTNTTTPPPLSSESDHDDSPIKLDLSPERSRFARQPRRAATPPSWGWRFGVMLLCFLLLVQLVVVFRQSLAKNWPSLRPWLLQMCQTLYCDLPLPKDPHAIIIQGSQLHPDPRVSDQFELIVQIRNRARYPLEYPHLELTLTDARDRPLARRVFAPVEWIQALDPQTGFRAGGELEASLGFSAAGIPAMGYRIYAFYP